MEIRFGAPRCPATLAAVKVLVVEDERKIAALVRKALEAAGFIVDATGNGDEGFTLATTRPYDALVLDVMVPGRAAHRSAFA